MHVHNVHERTLPAPAGVVGELIDGLATDADRLWPTDRWPPMRFDARAVRVGARGGHGPIRYEVAAHEPGVAVRFRFVDMPGFRGEHGFGAVALGADRCVLRHSLTADVSGAFVPVWVALVRRMHDALIEDALDRAQLEVTGVVASRGRRAQPGRLARAWGRRRQRPVAA